MLVTPSLASLRGSSGILHRMIARHQQRDGWQRPDERSGGEVVWQGREVEQRLHALIFEPLRQTNAHAAGVCVCVCVHPSAALLSCLFPSPLDRNQTSPNILA